MARPALHRVLSKVSASSKRLLATLSASSPGDAFSQAGLFVTTSVSAGRGLGASASFRAGDVVFTEAAPLLWVCDPLARGSTCAHCLGPLRAGARVRCATCGECYCGSACRAAALAGGGHELTCGGAEELDAWCAERRMNFPRAAAQALGRSLAAGADFDAFWAAVYALSYATPPPEAQLPRPIVEGYAQVKAAVLRAGKLGGDGVGAFFDSAFSLRAYARLAGALRLNSFSVPCPLGGGGGGEVLGGAGGDRDGGEATRACDGGAEGGAAGAGAAEGACRGAAGAPAAGGGCGSGEGAGACGDSAPALGDAPGGTALYALASLAQHECEPSCDVVLAAGGALALRARRDIPAGGAVTITYLDSSLPLEPRRRKLLQYGFECRCSMCETQAGRRNKQTGR